MSEFDKNQIIKEHIINRGIIPSGIIKNNDIFSNMDYIDRHVRCFSPEEAFLMKNSPEDIVTPNDNPKKVIRRIFSLIDNNWSDYEKTQLKDFRKYLISNESKFQVNIPEDFSEEIILRFLQATQFNFQKSNEYLHNHIKWKEIYFPFELNKNIIEILSSGFLYSYGRDKQFRPIVILNTSIYIKNKSQYPYDDWLKAIIYFLEYLIHHLLIPGTVEDWCVISDMRGVSMFSFPSELNDFIKVMQSNYRARLKTNFIIGMNFILRGMGE